MTKTTTTHRTIHVDQAAAGRDAATGALDAPFTTIQEAADIARPGDTIVIHEGVYRERVCPAQGGEEGQPITFAAAEGATVCIRGSDVLAPDWKPLAKASHVFVGSLDSLKLGSEAYDGRCDADIYGNFNPFLLNFNRGKTARPHRVGIEKIQDDLIDTNATLNATEPGEDIVFSRAQKTKARLEVELEELTRDKHRKYRTTLGQVFVNGEPMAEVETVEELHDLPGTWMVSPEGDAIHLHPRVEHEPLDEQLVEVSTRHTIFAPLKRGLGHIHVRGLTIEHAANHFPTWGKEGWPQVGALSTRSGHHWVVEHCTIRYAKGLGVDCGSEGGSLNTEFRGNDDYETQHKASNDDTKGVGYHILRHNRICDNGHCGIAGIRHTGTQLLHNVIERNNCDGHTSPWWEFGGVKFHFFFDGLIEGNLIRDNEAHGIWIDNQWRGSRITRNVIVNNMWSGINVELGRGPVLIDNNIIAHTRQGDGIYGHDVSDVMIAHNLLYANANFGVWFAYATPRVKPQDGCWDIKTFNNMILGNRAGAIGYSMPWECAGNNQSDGNLLMGGGAYLDEGSGPQAPLFQITNRTHCGGAEHLHDFPVMTEQRTREMFTQHLKDAGVPESDWPNLDDWMQHYLVDLDLWRAVFDNDRKSVTTTVIRDGLNTQRLCWQFDLKDDVRKVECSPIEGVDKDFRGQPMPEENLLPGPFQDVLIGRNNVLLWPVR